MRHLHFSRPALALALAALVLAPLPGRAEGEAANLPRKRAEQRLNEIAAAFPGKIGLYARNLATGEEIAVNAGDSFPMASVYKIPILVQVFRDAEAGLLSLEDRVEIPAEDKSPGSGLLKFFSPGLQPTVHDLALMMIVVSDNLATDLLLERVKPDRVTATMRELGIEGITVSRPTRELIRDWIAAPNRTFLEDGRDQATPRGMADLLALIQEGKAAGKESCEKMLFILRQQQFRQRIPRYLADKSIASKTGSIGYSINDAGLVTAANGAVIALAVFTAKTELASPSIVSEEAIGQAAAAVHDYFIYAAPKTD